MQIAGLGSSGRQMKGERDTIYVVFAANQIINAETGEQMTK